MKAGRRIATALRIIGWVMIALAVGVTIYVLATAGPQWGVITKWLNAGGVQQNIVDKVGFDHQFYNALSDAADTKTMQETMRVSRARSYFTRWENLMEKANASAVQDALNTFYAEHADGLTVEDAQAYLAYYEQMESGEESRLLKEAFEYLDGLAKPAAGKGKLAKLQAASVEPDVKAAYDAFAEANGEQAGAYLEFVESVVAMIREDIASGTAVSDVKGYVKNLDETRYAAALAEIQAQEREETEDLRLTVW